MDESNRNKLGDATDSSDQDKDKVGFSSLPLTSRLLEETLKNMPADDIVNEEVEETERKERLKSEEENRKAAGMTTPEEDWKEATRRAITAKIGQLLNNAETIDRVTTTPPVYTTLLSALAKSLVLQVETLL
ncbi:hypothetical protein F5876DRAFT_69129 [Lentinula aff. lateritia]|uniref:Uncharacterized protein n=1 Tax=Lentinula aff. lateritia TaxID=2804960 RepID=A0ACC1TNB7_9AGAR|nr:hypothetical protein F5876DRAFT_69129 [Lentinula aff. lateritia]